MYVNKVTVNVNKGKELQLLRLSLGDNNNCMLVDGSSAHYCGYVAYNSLAVAAWCVYNYKKCWKTYASIYAPDIHLLTSVFFTFLKFECNWLVWFSPIEGVDIIT